MIRINAKIKNLSLGGKVLALFLAVGIITLIGAISYFSYIIRSELDTLAAEKLKDNTESLRQLLIDESDRIKIIASIFSNTDSLGEAIYFFAEASDRGQIADELKSLLKEFPITLLLASDINGKVAFRGHEPDKHNDNIKENWLTQNGLKGENTTGYFKDQNGLALRAGGPLIMEGDIVGYIEAGKFIDNSFAKNLKKLILSDVTFYYNESPIASSLKAENNSFAIAGLTKEKIDRIRAAEGITEEKEINKIDYISHYFVLDNPGDTGNTISVRVSLNRQATQLILNRIWQMTLALALVSAAIMFVVSKSFTEFVITKPIKKVINRIKDIAEGEGDLTQRLEIRTGDELGETCEMVQYLYK